jgi:Uma2 family endonuclease
MGNTLIAEPVAERLFTVEEWLEFEKRSEVRHEFYFGQLIPMAGEAKKANRIANNFFLKLSDPLEEKGFEMFTHDVKAEVLPNGIYRYPDLVVAPLVDDEHDYIVKHPVLLLEVASTESAYRDRVKKRKEYHQVVYLWYYMIVSQDEMSVERHQRNEDGTWDIQYFTEPDDEIVLPRLGVSLKVSDLYARIKF